MSKKRLNQDEALKSLLGGNNNEPTNTDDNATATPSSAQVKANEEKNKPTSFYITDKHRKALKLKIALSDNPEDKDYSSIVRAALDAYLFDILKDL